MRSAGKLIAAAALLAAAVPATARAGDDAVVAVLPIETADDSLSLYSRPVTNAITARLGRVDGVDAEPVSLSGAVPVHVALVVGGRLVPAGRGRVKLELRVRDPGRGVNVARVATADAPLSDIDRLVDQAGERLGPLVTAAIAEQRERARARAAEPVELPVTVVDGIAPEAGDRRPRLVVLEVTGAGADGAVPLARTATAEAYRMVNRLGYRPVPARAGASSHQDAAALARAAGADGTLHVHFEELRFDWRGVLLARGRVRVVVTAPDGRRLLDRRMRTGTLVGSRGDRHAALVRFTAEQVMIMAAPWVRRALRRPSPDRTRP